MMKYFWILFLALACAKKPELQGNFPYDFEKPEIFEMPDQLQEISGIIYTDTGKLAAIEDNYGDIYFYDLKAKTVTRSFNFGGPGDYEDLAKVGEFYYVLRSDGVIFKTNGKFTSKYETRLSKKNNAEGLFYDSLNYRLLIALKGKPEEGEGKEIWSFDLRKEKLSDYPLFSIKSSQFETYFGKKVKKLNFSPSGLAIHPISGNLYIISSTAKLLVKTDFAGHILDADWIDEEYFTQPEGIAFDPRGTMYISNEGKKGKANVVRFKMIKND